MIKLTPEQVARSYYTDYLDVRDDQDASSWAELSDAKKQHWLRFAQRRVANLSLDRRP